MAKQQNEDQIIWQNVLTGKRKAFELLYLKYYGGLCKYALIITRSKDLAEEVVQALFSHLWESKEELNLEKNLQAYLFAAVKNRSLNLIKSEKVRSSYEILCNTELSFSQNQPIQFRTELFNQALHEALQQLPQKCREIFAMAKNEGLSMQEIAASLDVSPKTVENQLGIAMKKLRLVFKQKYTGTSSFY
mgnify:CR=1 FL=1